MDVGHDGHGPIGQPDPDRLREHGSPRSAGPRPPRQSFARSTITVAVDAGSSAWATPVVLKFAKGSEVALRGARGRSSRSGTAAEPWGSVKDLLSVAIPGTSLSKCDTGRDHALVTEDSLAPDLVGLHPDDAARRCIDRGLELNIEDAQSVESYWGHGQPWRITEQSPKFGQRMSSHKLVVRVSLGDGPDGAAVREPRRPLSPDRTSTGDVTGTQWPVP